MLYIISQYGLTGLAFIPELIESTITNPNLLANAYLPSVVLFLAFGYSLYFAYTRGRYFVGIASVIFLVGGLHQLAELETWRRTGEVPFRNGY